MSDLMLVLKVMGVYSVVIGLVSVVAATIVYKFDLM